MAKLTNRWKLSFHWAKRERIPSTVLRSSAVRFCASISLTALRASWLDLSNTARAAATRAALCVIENSVIPRMELRMLAIEIVT